MTENCTGIQEPALHDQVSELLDRIDNFNVPLCQLKLRAVLATATQKSFDAAVNTLITIIMERAKASTDAFANIWAALISGLPSKQALQVNSCTNLCQHHGSNIDIDSPTGRE